MTIRLAAYTGKDTIPHLPVLARLCTVVFREWPHLYDGDGSYDAGHLRSLADSARAMLVMAYDGAEPIGGSTCLPLQDATHNVQAPFIARGWSPARFFYLAESVVLPRWRGHGTGRAFFAMREAHAIKVSHCDFACFCTIVRPEQHPSRPSHVRSLEDFRRHQGYSSVQGLHCSMSWREIGMTGESELTLQFWVKSLTGAPLTP
jgi:GNAT superfamily N-acetyltransferase